MIADFPATLPQISNQLFATIKLRARRLVAIEIADQTNPKRDIVQIITVDVATINLAPPPVAHFDLTITGRSAVADDEMVSEPVLHPAKMTMVIIECGRVSLPGPAVVNNDVLPPAARHRSAIDLAPNRGR